MGQTRMFRDRVVSMEQTLEGGEKHLPLLKDLCREALPGFEYADHALDHERDLFVMELRGPDGSAKKIAWTRMVLFDAERIPTLTGDPAAVLRGKIVDFLKAHAARPEIVVTFRHLEEGWVDTPEPRREGPGRRRRRGGRGGAKGGERGQERRPGTPPASSGGERRPAGPRPPSAGSRPPSGGPRPASGGPRPPSAGPRPPSSGAAPGPQRSGGRPPMPASGASGAGGSGEGAAEGAAGKRRRRFRRRRRGGRGPGGGGNPGASGPANPGGGGAPRP